MPFRPSLPLHRRSRAAAGMPLNRDGLFAEAAITYSGRRYDDTSFYSDFDSVGAEVRLVYRFGL